MPIPIELPHVGETVTHGVIQKWLKQPGQRVEKYDPLVEVETDKVTMEVPSPVSGVLVKTLVAEGASVLMGTPICEIETGETPSGETPPSPAGAQKTSAEQPQVGTTGVLVEPGAVIGPTGVRETREEAPAGEKAPGEPARAVAAEAEAERLRLSPVVRRLAAEHGVAMQELASIKATGLGGRVTREDLLQYVERRKAPVATAPKAPLATAVPPSPLEADEEVLPLTAVRRRIAENMTRSATQIPTAWTMVEVDVTGLVRWREAIKEEFQRREGVELTYLPFAMKAAVESLKEHPRLNSVWGEDKIILKRRINIGVAVAAPQGLVVPVVHDADRFSVAALARAVRDVITRARESKLTVQDVQGGTFTVNNTGVLGSVISYPIINYPQAAVLTTEAIIKRPVVVEDAIAIRWIMSMCLAFDHRILDGAEAGAFLQSVKRRLEVMGPNTPLY
ncbi:MAG: 2-oxo acid dehydrogenase subunit E2 [Chloroflexi bacterium]|nr:2-oxo acid dehydrogenase subunit E2 [Chloroflexota bacterium]